MKSKSLCEEPQKSNHKAWVLENSLTLCINKEIRYWRFAYSYCHLLDHSYQPGKPREEGVSALPQCGLWNTPVSSQYGIYTAFYKGVRIPVQQLFSQRDLTWVLTWILSKRAHRENVCPGVTEAPEHMLSTRLISNKKMRLRILTTTNPELVQQAFCFF